MKIFSQRQKLHLGNLATMRRLRRVLKICLICKKEFSVVLARDKITRYCSNICRYTGVGMQMKGLYANEKHPQWKGEKVNYGGLHSWLGRQLGKPQECEDCGTQEIPEDKKRWFEWANISGKYLRDRLDWKRLCRPCHEKMDSPLKPRGEGHHLAKLRKTDIPLIKELLVNSTMTYKHIGEIFGVARSTIGNIAYGNSWVDIS